MNKKLVEVLSNANTNAAANTSNTVSINPVNNMNKMMQADRIYLNDTGNDEISIFSKSANSLFNKILMTDVETKLLFDMIPYTFLHIDSSGNIINRKILDPIGVNAAMDVGMSISKILDSKTLNALAIVISESEKKKIAILMDLCIESNSAKQYFETIVISMGDKGYLLLLKDITDRKRTENEFIKKNNELERFNKFATDREIQMIDLKKQNDLLLKDNNLLKKEVTEFRKGHNKNPLKDLY